MSFLNTCQNTSKSIWYLAAFLISQIFSYIFSELVFNLKRSFTQKKKIRIQFQEFFYKPSTFAPFESFCSWKFTSINKKIFFHSFQLSNVLIWSYTEPFHDTLDLNSSFCLLSVTKKNEKWHAEIEDTRIYGRRILLSDIYNDSLKWKPFNGSWINGKCTSCRMSSGGTWFYRQMLLLFSCPPTIINDSFFVLFPSLRHYRNIIIITMCQPTTKMKTTLHSVLPLDEKKKNMTTTNCWWQRKNFCRQGVHL